MEYRRKAGNISPILKAIENRKTHSPLIISQLLIYAITAVFRAKGDFAQKYGRHESGDVKLLRIKKSIYKIRERTYPYASGFQDFFVTSHLSVGTHRANKIDAS